MNTSKTILGLAIVIALGAVGWYFYSGKVALAPTQSAPAAAVPTPTPTPQANQDIPIISTPTQATVTYDGTAFSPAAVTINKGGTVTFFNKGASAMWIASGVHPSHTRYDGTSLSQHCAAGATPSFDQCKSGEVYSFTFNQVGTWPYHDHLNAAVHGTVVVQ